MRQGKGTLALAGLAALLLFTGCAFQGPGDSRQTAPDFFSFGEQLARQLDVNVRQPLGQGDRLIIASFVNLDQLYETSRFGRALPEAMANRLFQRGYGLVEVRQAAELLLKGDAGELILTRDAAMLARQHEAAAIIAGTYVLTSDSVLVSVRMLDPVSQEVQSVATLEILRTSTLDAMLFSDPQAGGTALSAYER